MPTVTATGHPADLLLRHLCDLATAADQVLANWEGGDDLGVQVTNLSDALEMAVGNLGEHTLGLTGEDDS